MPIDDVPTYELLGHWIDLVNERGPNSAEACAYLVAHRENAELIRLASAAEQLRELFDSKGEPWEQES